MSNQTSNDIIDINIGGIGRKKIRVNGDDSKILLLNVNDNNVVVRYMDEYPKLKELETDFKELGAISIDSVDTETFMKFSEKAKQIDEKMKTSLDYIFNSNVAEVCSDGGSMYDILDSGAMRWESILTALLNLYTETISKNAEQMSKVKELTAKYN